MDELRVVRRMATWWQCAVMLAVAAFFGWVVREGLRSTSGTVFVRTIIPAYGLFLYATLASLVNRRSVVVTRDGVLVTNGPLPLGHGRRWIPRGDVAFCWHMPVVAVADAGDSAVLWHDVGIETRAGRAVPAFAMIEGAAEARAAAERIAAALGSASDWTVVPVRQVSSVKEDPAEQRTVRRWVAATLVAVAAGVVWEVASR